MQPNASKHRVLILYYSFTNQTQRVAEAMGEVFRELDCEVELCNIEFVDEHYRIERPFKPVIRKLLSWFLPQVLGKCGAVRVPEEILNGNYDLICLGSPTWWLNPAMPVVSFLKSSSAGGLLEGKQFAVFAVCRGLWRNNVRRVKKLARKQGATFVDAAAFCFQGNQVQSALSFISYMQNDANLDRFWGVQIYEFGIAQEGIAKAKEFAHQLAAGLEEESENDGA
jgi:flavodoxin